MTQKSATTNTATVTGDCAHNKLILADPVAYLCRLQADDSTTVSRLEALCAQRQSLETRQKDIQAQTGRLSRQIGQARRNARPAGPLIDAMQALSAENKNLLLQIKQLNDSILDVCTPPHAPADDNRSQQSHGKPSTGQPSDILPADSDHKRRYPATAACADDIVISLFEESADVDEWNQYVGSNPAACIHHRAEWRHILQQSYGHEGLYLCARDGHHKLVGILPLVQMKSRLFGNKLVSMPFFQRGGALADSAQIEHRLMQAAVDYASAQALDHIEFRDDIPRQGLPQPSAIQTHKVNMVLSLPPGEQTLWQGFTPKLRAQIRRAQRQQAEVCIGGREYLKDFYRVYSRNMRDLGSPVQSRRFIDNILRQFPQNSWLIVIKLGQRPVAAGFLLASGDTMEIPLASTIRDVNHLSMNMFLYWEILKFAVKQHYRLFDFGRSSKNAGTYRFKQQWGAEPAQLYWHYWLGSSGQVPSLNPSSAKYAIIIRIWQRLPLVLANLLGPAIVKNIP